MAVKKLKEGVYFVGAIHWDRKLFDELIPLPEGTSYNSYFIKGKEKSALIDGVDPSKEYELFENLKSLGVEKIDYIISHHAEQDHSGAIPSLLSAYPMTKVVTNEKCKSFLKSLLLIPEDRFLAVKEGDLLHLGGKTLQFFMTPWVHWPETMISYLKEDKILFSCDFFGSHLATSEIMSAPKEEVYVSAKRYYAEIMMPFRTSIKKHLEKVKTLEIEIIAPSHGPIHMEPEFIIDAYKEWVSDEVKNEVILPFVSMHGSTKKMVDYFIDLLMERNVVVKPFNLTVADIGELAMALVDAATVVIASPTMLVGAHPYAVYAAYLINALRPKLRFYSFIGSYGWGGKMVDQLKGLLGNLKAEFLDPVIVLGYPKEDDFKALEKLADRIVEKHRELGIAK